MGLGGELTQPFQFNRSTASTSITIPTNAVKELHMMRRHSSDDRSAGRRTHTNSFEATHGPAGGEAERGAKDGWSEATAEALHRLLT